MTQVYFSPVLVKGVRQWEEWKTGAALFQYCLRLEALRTCPSEFTTGDSEVQRKSPGCLGSFSLGPDPENKGMVHFSSVHFGIPHQI